MISETTRNEYIKEVTQCVFYNPQFHDVNENESAPLYNLAINILSNPNSDLEEIKKIAFNSKESTKRYRPIQEISKKEILTHIFNRAYNLNPNRVIIATTAQGNYRFNRTSPLWRRVCFFYYS